LSRKSSDSSLNSKNDEPHLEKITKTKNKKKRPKSKPKIEKYFANKKPSSLEDIDKAKKELKKQMKKKLRKNSMR
jgi:hypothetical protein